jgi:hypothetical protein
VGCSAAALLAGCGGTVSGTPRAADVSPTGTTAPTDASGDPLDGRTSASPSGLTLPPIGLTLQGLLVDPDPMSEGPATGTVTIARLTDKKLLATVDVNCLRDNGFRVGFAKDAAGEPAMTTWAFELSSPEGARNCAEQMKRTDASIATPTDLTAAYDLPGVDVYREEVRDGRDTLVILRAIYTRGNRLFRVTVSQQNVAPSTLEGRFRDLLRRQVALTPAE